LDSISGARIFLIFTYRPDFVHTWGGRSYHSQVNLNRLSNRESLAVANHLLGSNDIDIDLEELILEKTEGVPFFIEELVKSLKELRIIEKKNNSYQLVKHAQEVAIPTTIQDVIMARVDSLPEGAKEVLQTGSVIEREFGYGLIKRVIDLSQEELLSHLSVLKDSELIYERGIYPQSSYIFKHALTQDVVYDSILTRRRKEIHGWVGEAIENLYTERLEEFYEMLAFHYTEAGLIEKAIGYWQLAGTRASERSAYLEAISHLTKGLELLMTLPDTPERVQHELTLQLALGSALQATKGYAAPEREKVYTRAWELCQQIGEAPEHFPVLFGLWQFYTLGGQLQKGREVGERLLSHAQRQHDPALMLEAHRALGFTLLSLAEYTQAREHGEHGFTLYDPKQHRSHAFIYGQDPGMTCLIYAAVALWLLGHPDQARARSHEALSLAQEQDHPYSIVWALSWIAQILQFCGELQEVKERTETATALAREQGFPLWEAWGMIIEGWVRAQQGREEEGIAQIQQGLAGYGATGSETMRLYFLALQVEAYEIVGKVEEGLTVLDEAIALVHKSEVRFYEAELYRLKGELLRKDAEDKEERQKIEVEAEACFLKALEISRQQGAKSMELRTTMSLSRLWQSQDKKKEAHDLLSKIYNWFTEGFDTTDLKNAKKLLDELS